MYRDYLKMNLIPSAITETVADAVDEVIIEEYIEKLCEKLTIELAHPLAGHMYDMVKRWRLNLGCIWVWTAGVRKSFIKLYATNDDWCCYWVGFCYDGWKKVGKRRK